MRGLIEVGRFRRICDIRWDVTSGDSDPEIRSIRRLLTMFTDRSGPLLSATEPISTLNAKDFFWVYGLATSLPANYLSTPWQQKKIEGDPRKNSSILSEKTEQKSKSEKVQKIRKFGRKFYLVNRVCDIFQGLWSVNLHLTEVPRFRVRFVRPSGVFSPHCINK